ncbi:MAG: methyltransferase [Bacteroidales bacterium]|nr:methyltransferase [Bacteroidales bacterium]
MSVFRFKRFEVVNERSAMKVNTDGVLLGAAMTILPEDRRYLDIGTGTGTIALMAAQRSGADISIDAIDIDEPSASEAAMNFSKSPWAENLKAHNMSLDEFSEATDGKYDLIFSNPPYFEDSLTAPDERKSTARHTSEGLSYRDIFDFASDRLTEKGRVSFVLPSDQELALCRYARMSGFHLFRILRIRTVPRKQPTRIIAEFSHERCAQPSDSILTIQDEGKYTSEYLSLTHDFYLFA